MVGPVRLQGLKEYRGTWVEEFFPWYDKTGRFELVDPKVSAGTEVVFATALPECVGTEDGKKVAFILRPTVGLEKHSGEWIIVREHHSQPLDFDVARLERGRTEDWDIVPIQRTA